MSTIREKGIVKQAAIILQTNTKYKLSKNDSGKYIANIEGAFFEDLSNKEIKKYKIQGGAKVYAVHPGKCLDKGIKRGFVVTSVMYPDLPNKKTVAIKNIKVLCAALNEAEGTTIVMTGFYPNNPLKKEVYALY